MRVVNTCAVLIGLASALAVATQADAYSVTKHARHQQYRINAGVKHGQLTPAEDQRLQTRENNITTTEANEKAANGGTLTTREKLDLGARQAALSGSIAVDKHNAATTAPTPQ